MASFNGLVKFNDSAIMHFKYNATGDGICIPKLHNSFEEVSENWDSNNLDIPNNCKHNVEDVNIFAVGSYWKAKACRKCGYLIDKYNILSLNWDEQIWETPEWVKEYCEKHNAEWMYKSI